MTAETERKIHDTLSRYFGFKEFRPGQEKLIDAVLSGRDCLGIMPTGGGKSLCYQVPALLLPGVTLVVSPLISLMTDQVAALRENGVGAAFINSTLSEAQYAATLRGLRAGEYKLLYIAPERLELDGFRAALADIEVPLVAVDEAHCVSQWGQDFRPSYLRIAPAIASMRRRPAVAAFTATATERVREDIVRLLGLSGPEVLVTGFDRPNLYFEVRTAKNKDAELLRLIDERRGRSGIVYCATRAAVEEVCELLRARGIIAVRYHAGLSDNERASAQEAFQYDDAEIMVATNAFGMGIDKSNVGWVIHYNMPKSLDAYYQEAGRAGRDGERADCILLYSGRDAATARYLIEHSESTDAQADIRRLGAMIGYCKTDLCLRGYILGYFGQEHPVRCGGCSNCLNSVEVDITTQAQMILSCVERVKARLHYSVGRRLITDVLRGEMTEKVMESRLQTLSTFALMEGVSRSKLEGYIDRLVDRGYLAYNEFKALYCTQKAAEVLFGGERVISFERAAKPARARRGGARAAAEALEPAAPAHKPSYDSEALYDALRRVRARAAKQANVPAYVIFSNAALQAMAERAPTTRREFLEVPGVGEKKLESYGDLFIDAVNKFLQDNS